MPTLRKMVFANDQIYHIFNRGVEKRLVFSDKRDYQRALLTLEYYSFVDIPVKLSRYLTLSDDERNNLFHGRQQNDPKLVEILAYCLMPNHFHLLLRQTHENGISRFISHFTNSYTRYYNTKNDRVGALFQGVFKAVYVEDDDQLVHLSRYIHLNPATAFIIKPENVTRYPWSSLSEYFSDSPSLSNPQTVLNYFDSLNAYKSFVLDYVNYAQELGVIKHLALD